MSNRGGEQARLRLTTRLMFLCCSHRALPRQGERNIFEHIQIPRLNLVMLRLCAQAKKVTFQAQVYISSSAKVYTHEDYGTYLAIRANTREQNAEQKR